MSLFTDDESMSLSVIVETVVTFPPSQLVDFVLHYDNTAFHVHKLILHHHSAYFRTYFRTLPTPSECACQKRKKSGLDGCEHAHIAHCIHLPGQTTLVDREPVTADDMDLFLRHLYFANHYRCPPFQPKMDMDVDHDPPPVVSLHFPSVQQLSWGADTQLRHLENNTRIVYHVSLLTLANYLDCAQMMEQCEAVLMSPSHEVDDRTWLLKHCRDWLSHASRYKLDKAKAFFIATIVADKGMMDCWEYKRNHLWMGKALVMEILEAALNQRTKRPWSDNIPTYL